MAPTGSGKETIDAPYRLKLALDRTMLAWLRTSIALAGFGFALVAFFRAVRTSTPTLQAARFHLGAIRFGTALLALGIFATIGSALGYLRTLRKLKRGEALTVRQWPLSVTLGFLVAAIGLVGFWFVLRR
jgi:uncharacterized membrane protein YidH (DUF202 family)